MHIHLLRLASSYFQFFYFIAAVHAVILLLCLSPSVKWHFLKLRRKSIEIQIRYTSVSRNVTVIIHKVWVKLFIIDFDVSLGRDIIFHFKNNANSTVECNLELHFQLDFLVPNRVGFVIFTYVQIPLVKVCIRLPIDTWQLWVQIFVLVVVKNHNLLQ